MTVDINNNNNVYKASDLALMRSIYKKPRLRPNENFIRHIFTYLEKTLP
jgi:hypothetical protein